MKFQASIHGIDLEKEMKKKGVDIMEPQHDKVTKVESCRRCLKGRWTRTS